jgi:HEAT repeat protein
MKVSAAGPKTPATPTPPDESPRVDKQAIDRSVARCKDTRIPLLDRIADIKRFGKQGDAQAAATLMAIGNEHTYLNWAAVNALGDVRQPGVADYLRKKSSAEDARIVAAAVQALARLEGAASVSYIAGVLAANHKRPDGHQDIVCFACVGALVSTGSAKALAPLGKELSETVGHTALQHNYGSHVVKALQTIGDKNAVPLLTAYADRLERDKQQHADNPMGLRYLDAKIKEARLAAENLKGGTNR